MRKWDFQYSPFPISSARKILILPIAQRQFKCRFIRLPCHYYHILLHYFHFLAFQLIYSSLQMIDMTKLTFYTAISKYGKGENVRFNTFSEYPPARLMHNAFLATKWVLDERLMVTNYFISSTCGGKSVQHNTYNSSNTTIHS